jgi:hypothetical protein
MSSNRFPIVGDNTLFGEAARLATRAEVGAVLVVSTKGLSLVPIEMLPGQKAGKIGSITAQFGIPLTSPETAPAPGFALKSIMGDMAEIRFPAANRWNLNLVVGHKECSVDPSHSYPARYPKTDCPHQDGGKLILKTV